MHLKPISRDLRRDLYKRLPGDGMIVRKKKKKKKTKKNAVDEDVVGGSPFVSFYLMGKNSFRATT
jgi:hypothetical protein